MPPDVAPTPAPRFVKLFVVLAVAAVAVLVLLGLKVWVWDKYDPSVTDRPDVKEVMALVNARRTGGPLTDAQFQRGVELLRSDTDIAKLAAITLVQAEGEMTPARKEAAVAALDECANTASPKVTDAAKRAAARLRGEEK